MGVLERALSRCSLPVTAAVSQAFGRIDGAVNFAPPLFPAFDTFSAVPWTIEADDPMDDEMDVGPTPDADKKRGKRRAPSLSADRDIARTLTFDVDSHELLTPKVCGFRIAASLANRR